MKLVLAVLLFASPAFAQNKVAAADAMGSCGPREVHFDVKADKSQHAVTEVADGKALVYVIETQKRDNNLCLGCHVTTKIGVDGKWVGANRGDSFLSFSVDPGEHHLCINWQSSFDALAKIAAFANFNAEPGKVYFFRVRVVAVHDREGSIDVESINPDEGRYLVSSSPLSLPRAKS